MTKLRKMYRYHKFSYNGAKIIAEDFFPYMIERTNNRRIVPMGVFAKYMNVDLRTIKQWRQDNLLPVCIKVKLNEDRRGTNDSCFLLADLEVFFSENVYFSDGDLC